MPHINKIVGRIVTASLVLVAGAAMTLWARDVYQDRKHEVVIKGPVDVYRNVDWYAYPQGEPVKHLMPGKAVRVKRILYGKDFRVIQVQTEEGTVGWILEGENTRLVYRHDG